MNLTVEQRISTWSLRHVSSLSQVQKRQVCRAFEGKTDFAEVVRMAFCGRFELVPHQSMQGIIRFRRSVDKAIHHHDQFRVLPLSQDDEDQETNVLFTKERGAMGDAQRYECWLFVAGDTIRIPPSSTKSEASTCLCELFVSCTSAVVDSSYGGGWR